MHPNPFSPSFSVLPQDFYGRETYLAQFSEALDNPGSADRYLFLTGTRGCGKTSLLHQYAILARDRRWNVLETTSIDALDVLSHYAGVDRSVDKSVSLNPQVSVATMASVSLGEAKAHSTSDGLISFLSSRLTEKLRRLKTKRGLLLIIDEVQKIEQEHMVRICNAVQMTRAAGLEISFVLGGLPLAYSRIRSFKHCTFVRRMVRQRLWCMPVSETLGFFRSAFARVPEIRITEDQVHELAQFSGGHPYLMQLVGDNAYRITREEYAPISGTSVAVGEPVLWEAMRRSLSVYRENVLNDVLVGSHPNTRQYIRLACQLRDPDNGLTRVADINTHLSGDAEALYSRRANAIATQVIRPAGRGYVRLALPHFDQYYNAPDEEDEQSLDDQWVY